MNAQWTMVAVGRYVPIFLGASIVPVILGSLLPQMNTTAQVG